MSVADTFTKLRALEELSGNAETTQRDLSRRLNISLGRTNSLVKNLVSSGLVEMDSMNGRRVHYRVTQEGHKEQEQTAIAWARTNNGCLASARKVLQSHLAQLTRDGHSRVVCLGRGNLFEVVVLAVADLDMEITAVVDPDIQEPRCCGIPVVSTIQDPACSGATIALRLSRAIPGGLFSEVSFLEN